jgi:hypothetical protein
MVYEVDDHGYEVDAVHGYEVDSSRGSSAVSSAASSRYSKQDENTSSPFPDEEMLSSVESSYLDDDDDDETAEPTSETNQNSNQNDNPLSEMQKYAAMENRLVNRWRRIVIISILLAGAMVGSITYVTLNDSQSDDSADAVRIVPLYTSIYVNKHRVKKKKNTNSRSTMIILLLASLSLLLIFL